jgi:hypothetical protein
MPITLTHPTDSSITWTSGFRGKRPNWVKAILEADPTLLPVTAKEETFIPPTDPNVVRYWKWNGLNDEDGKGIALIPCIVGAKSGAEALSYLNKTFKNPVFGSEWTNCWREVPAKNVELGGKEGVFTFNKITSVWEQRPSVASSNSGKH